MSDNARIDVFSERCMGAGNCAEVAPKYFDQSDLDGTVIVRQQTIDSGDDDLVGQAVDICPVAALEIAARAS